MTHEQFIGMAKDASGRAATKMRFSPVIATAQAALESSFGRSVLAKSANNLFGVKAGRMWKGETVVLPTKEFVAGGWTTVAARWRKYRDWDEAFLDYGSLIERVYPHAAATSHSPRQYLEALVGGYMKYATDPDYVSKVWEIVEQYKLLPLTEELPIFRLFDRKSSQQVGRIVGRVVGDKIYFETLELFDPQENG